MTAKDELPLGEARLIRGYMLRLVALPGAVLTLVAFALGYFIQEGAAGKAYQQAYTQAVDVIGQKANETAMTVADNAATVRQLLAASQDTFKRIQSAELLAGQQINEIAENLLGREDFMGQLTAETVKECRVCFRETERSDQCGGSKEACSGWVGPGNPGGAWSAAFRDDTDDRDGGCRYQWKLECR